MRSLLLDPPLTQFLCRLEAWDHGYHFLDPLSLTEATWGGRDLSALRLQLAVDERSGRVQVTGEGPVGSVLPGHLAPDRHAVLPFRGTVTDRGLVFRCAQATIEHLVGRTRAEFECYVASVSRGDERARLWLGRLRSYLRPSPNVKLTWTRPDGTHDYYRCTELQGAHTYYWVHRFGQDGFFVIDAGPSGELDQRGLELDFLALQFTLGEPLEIMALENSDERSHLAQWRTAILGQRTEGRVWTRPTVPPTVDGAFVALFESVSRSLRTREDLRLPTQWYVDALSDADYHSAYLRLQVALEVTAKKLASGEPKAQPLVRNVPAWRDWLDAHRGEIESQAADGKAEQLLGKLRAAVQAPSGDRVPAAFQKHGIALDKELIDSSAIGRNRVVHEARIPARNKDDADRALNIVRTMLVALVALEAGYRGPLQGWEYEGTGVLAPAPETFWPFRNLMAPVQDVRGEFTAEFLDSPNPT